jgi:hypothetical protein
MFQELKEGDRIVSWPMAVEADDEWVRKGRAGLSPSWQYFSITDRFLCRVYCCS